MNGQWTKFFNRRVDLKAAESIMLEVTLDVVKEHDYEVSEDLIAGLRAVRAEIERLDKFLDGKS